MKTSAYHHLKFLCLLLFIGSTLLFSCGKSKKLYDSEAQAKAAANYSKYCSGCHYPDLGWFKNRQWKYGNTPEDIANSIKKGHPDYGMPSFSKTLSDQESNDLATYILATLDSSGSGSGTQGQSVQKTEKLNIRLDALIDGLESPWGMAFLPNGDLLVSEKSGKILRFQNGQQIARIQGLPEIHVDGQGGLFDLRLHPDFKNNGIIYFAYNSPGSNGWNTAVMMATLQDNSLSNQQVIFKAIPDSKSNIQFGGRITFDNNGHIYFSTGDRGEQDMAQDLTNDNGKIHRLNLDGSVPSDNPFLNKQGARPSIWSYGHRNPEGLMFNLSTGILWEHEHGPMGGDELNIIEKGQNYGWPVVTFGKNYDGTTISNYTSKPGMVSPIIHWTPSMAPSGMDFVSGNLYKGWEGDILVGALKFKYLVRLEISGSSVTHQEIMFKDIGRLRNVVMGPDGYVYIATELPGTIYRLVPVQ